MRHRRQGHHRDGGPADAHGLADLRRPPSAARRRVRRAAARRRRLRVRQDGDHRVRVHATRARRAIRGTPRTRRAARRRARRRRSRRGHVAAAIGTQTNGSVIRPAAYCGVVGFKPTLGRDSVRRRRTCSAQTLDTVGTFTRTRRRRGAARERARRSGPHRAARSRRWRARRGSRTSAASRGRSVGCDADDALDAAATRLRAAGADVVPVALPDALARGRARACARSCCTRRRAPRPRCRTASARGSSPALNAALDEGRAIGAERLRDGAGVARAR